MSSKITRLWVVGSVFAFFGLSAHALVTGASPSSPILKGCIVLNAIPVFSTSTSATSCGADSQATGQVAGTSWVAAVDPQGTTTAGWIASVTKTMAPGMSTYQLTAKAPFHNPPVCTVTPVAAVRSVSSVPYAMVVDVTPISITVSTVTTGSTVAGGPGFNISCSTGQ